MKFGDFETVRSRPKTASFFFFHWIAPFRNRKGRQGCSKTGAKIRIRSSGPVGGDAWDDFGPALKVDLVGIARVFGTAYT